MLHLLATALLLAPSHELAPGPWRAWLESPGGELPFELELGLRDGAPTCVLRNGAEQVELVAARDADGALVLSAPRYDSRVTATPSQDGRALDGAWVQPRPGGATRRMAFHARAGAAPRFASGAPAAPDRVAGRWRVAFEKDEHPAVAILAAEADALHGTVLTATGDHRFLAGTFAGGELRLSCFDFAHAFLYAAELQPDGTLAGTFWSGDAWTERFTARRDPDARLDDPYALARWSREPGLAWIGGVDLDGVERSLAESLFGSRALLVQIAGSWCPNCHDELGWLAPLAARLEPRGLRAVTLGFELGADRERDLDALRRMRDAHGAGHAFLLAGSAQKGDAQRALAAPDQVVAFPTLALFDADGRPLFVHTGFTGPAAPAEHAEETRDLAARIEAALDAPAGPAAETELLLDEILWRDERDRALVEFRRGDDGGLRYVAHEMLRFDRPTRTEPIGEGEVEVRGACLRFGGVVWQIDAPSKAVLDPLDLGHRLTPAVRGPFPYFDAQAHDAPADILAGLSSTQARARRECAWFLARQIVLKMVMPPDEAPHVDPATAVNLLPLLDDADPLVRATACWAAGLLRLEPARERLQENARHPFPAVRREARRALATLDAK